MEFLKSCSTNLQAVEGYSHIDYQIYNHSDTLDPAKSQWDDQEQRHHLLLALRQRRVLVQSAVMQKKVCVFGGFGAAEEHMKELGWQLHQRGRLEAAALTRPGTDPKVAVQNQHIFTMFLSAIESSLSISLQDSCGAVRVGHLTWIVPADSDHQTLSLRVQLTAQGTLALLPHASSTGLSCASEKDGCPVILAPSGTPATVASSLSSLSINDDAPPRQARREARLRLSRRAKDESWKSSATSRLDFASIPHQSPWMRVSLRPSKSAEQVSCLWPESLCLELPSRQTALSFDQVDSMDWLDSKNPYQNPLKSAESWFVGQAERDEMEQKSRQAEKEEETEKEAAAQVEEPVPEQPPIASPLYSRSVHDQISVNGIYPTPPDGVLPTVCTEPPASSVMAIDNLSGVPEDDPQTRRQSNISDLGLGSEHYRKDSTDELFGDMDEEMFGNADVTDADFNFFDDPGAAAAAAAIMPPPDPSQMLVESVHPPDPSPKAESVAEEPPTIQDVPEAKFEEPVERPVKEENDEKMEDSEESSVSTPPLSPLKIRETFLPSPTTGNHPNLRRDSTFLPVIFKTDFGNFDAKYRAQGKFNTGNVSTPSTGRSQSIALPQKAPKPRTYKSIAHRRATVATPRIDDIISYQDSDADTAQDSDSDSESDSSSDSDLPPLDIRKRKRPLADDGPARSIVESVIESDVESAISEESTMADPGPVLDQLLALRESQNRMMEHQHRFSDNTAIWKSPAKILPSAQTLSIWPVLDLSADDLIETAQLVAEQSLFSDSAATVSDNSDVTFPVYIAAQDALKQVFTMSLEYDFTKVGAIAAQHAEQQIAAAAKAQQRPAPRRPGPTNSVINIPAPSVQIRRAGEDWEMQPTALRFWESLSIEPASGPKDVIACAIHPDSGLLGETVADFLQDIRATYENRKLGSHDIGGVMDKENGLISFRPQGEPSTGNVLKGLHSACATLGDLINDSEFDSDKAIVVYIVNPFKEEAMIKYLCGCFHAGLSTVGSPTMPVLLQIIPINAIASPTSFIVPDQEWLSSLATFIYDRIPSTSPSDPKSAWQLASSPSTQLATPPTRKINFALTERIPRNLVEEAQILHVAYAINADNTWLTVAWTDNSGRRQHSTSYCLSNTDGRAVLTEVRDITLALCRNATFRIFVARCGVMRDWEKRVWREVTSENWSIVLLDIDVAPALQVSGSNSNEANQSAFMTPAATPQPSTFTSPETGGNPSTPAGETPGDGQQQDPDAFLIDTADETWGMLLPFSCTRNPALSKPLAAGLLLKRGHADTTANLPSLAVDLLEMVQPRSSDGGNWLQQRAPETVLKEVLVWFRGLGLLARIRGVKGAQEASAPWHVAVAICGCDALKGFLE